MYNHVEESMDSPPLQAAPPHSGSMRRDILRGPADDGCYSSDDVGVSMRRRSIVDFKNPNEHEAL